MITEQGKNELLISQLFGQAKGREVLVDWKDTYKVKRWWNLSEKRASERDDQVAIACAWLDQKPWYYIPHADWNNRQLVIGISHLHRRLLGHFESRVGIDEDSDSTLTEFVKGLDEGRLVELYKTYEWSIENTNLVLGGYTEILTGNGLNRWISWYLKARKAVN